jgi:hypothetical protein
MSTLFSVDTDAVPPPRALAALADVAMASCECAEIWGAGWEMCGDVRMWTVRSAFVRASPHRGGAVGADIAGLGAHGVPPGDVWERGEKGGQAGG